MRIFDTDIEFCLRIAKELSEQYHQYAQPPRDLKSIDDLVWLIGETIEGTITIYDLHFEAGRMMVRGVFVALQDGNFEINLPADLGEREQRFNRCKELFHVALDDDQCRNMDFWDHVEESQISFTIAESDPSSPVVQEMLAEIAAMEFLFPCERRTSELADAGESPDFEALATKYGISQVQIEYYLSDRMMAEFAKVNW